MQCECIKRIEKLNKEAIEKESGAKVTSIDIDVNYAIVDNSMIQLTYSRMTYKSTNYKRERMLKVLHTFCPFCGVRIVEGEK